MSSSMQSWSHPETRIVYLHNHAAKTVIMTGYVKGLCPLAISFCLFVQFCSFTFFTSILCSCLCVWVYLPTNVQCQQVDEGLRSLTAEEQTRNPSSTVPYHFTWDNTVCTSLLLGVMMRRPDMGLSSLTKSLSVRADSCRPESNGDSGPCESEAINWMSLYSKLQAARAMCMNLRWTHGDHRKVAGVKQLMATDSTSSSSHTAAILDASKYAALLTLQQGCSFQKVPKQSQPEHVAIATYADFQKVDTECSTANLKGDLQSSSKDTVGYLLRLCIMCTSGCAFW